MIKRKITLVFILIFVLATSTGCTKYGPIPGESKVLSKVAEAVPTEKYTLVSTEKSAGYPKKCTYYFKSEERDLEFTAESTRDLHPNFGGDGKHYDEEINIDYKETVYALYRDEIDDILSELNITDVSNDIKYGWMYATILDREECERYAEIIYEADQVYSRELEYNTEEWLDKNDILSLTITYNIPNSNEETFCIMNLNGQLTLEEIQNELDTLWETEWFD